MLSVVHRDCWRNSSTTDLVWGDGGPPILLIRGSLPRSFPGNGGLSWVLATTDDDF